MPELPEVETTRLGLLPAIQGARVIETTVRCRRLRWPIPPTFEQDIANQTVHKLTRRGKYLLLECDTGAILFHLGMSGRMRVLQQATPPDRHDHLDILFSNQNTLRLTDPRRFGCVLWTTHPYQHPLLIDLGVEPLTEAFTVDYLRKKAANRRVAVKTWIMNAKVVVGVGNIYATEALFLAGIHPCTPVKQLSDQQLQTLINTIQKVLKQAIAQGGTTLKDFLGSDGQPGYFSQTLHAYGRQGLPCLQCQRPLTSQQIGQRTTVFCEQCQS